MSVGKLRTVSLIGPQFPHEWGNWGPSQKTVLNFPTRGIERFIEKDAWGNSVPFFKTIHNFPTSGEIEDRLEKRYRISPLVGKLRTVLKNGTEFPHQWGNWGPSRETVLNFPTGGEIEDCLKKRYWISPLVGKLRTVSNKGIEFPHHNRKCILPNRDSVGWLSTVQMGGEIEYRLDGWENWVPFKWVGKLSTV